MKLWRISAWVQHWLGKLVTLAIVAALLYGLWWFRMPILRTVGFIEGEMREDLRDPAVEQYRHHDKKP
jgi:hypothetical protein